MWSWCITAPIMTTNVTGVYVYVYVVVVVVVVVVHNTTGRVAAVGRVQ